MSSYVNNDQYKTIRLQGTWHFLYIYFLLIHFSNSLFFVNKVSVTSNHKRENKTRIYCVIVLDGRILLTFLMQIVSFIILKGVSVVQINICPIAFKKKVRNGTFLISKANMVQRSSRKFILYSYIFCIATNKIASMTFYFIYKFCIFIYRNRESRICNCNDL